MKSRLATAGLLAAASCAAQAQEAPPVPMLREITVSTPRGEVRPFDVRGSVDRVEGSEMRDARPGVNLSESLGPVPGLQVQNRQNYAQDLQLSIRGFGARSTFGVRGVRLYVDGMPATLPDGQGQTSNIDIGSTGPDLALYASAGRGFETPTLNELSYRADGMGGLNFGLQPSVNTSVEVGAKARLAGGLLTAAR